MAMADNYGGAVENITPSEEDGKKEAKLTPAQLKRIQRNRERAVQLRRARISNLSKAENAVSLKQVSNVSRPRDTGGGFLLEDDGDDISAETRPVVNHPAPLFEEDRPKCEECKNELAESYLLHHFDHPVCDNCRDNDGDHCLISKTDAKKEYLLKDCDFDKREPPLKFILKKNPHNLHGNMKLYLRLQVEKRALEVFGSEDQLEEHREQRVEASEKRKQKAFDKKVKALRMAVRSSLYRKKDAGHEHEFGPECYNKDDDMYEKTCTSCGHRVQYEKM